MRTYATFLGAILMVTALGCEEPSAQRVTSAPQATDAANVQINNSTVGGTQIQSTAPQDQTLSSPAGAAAPDGAPPPAASDAAPDTQPTDPASLPVAIPPGQPAAEPSYREKAEAGVGEKGQNLPQGIYTTPAKAYFQTRERLAFIQVEQAINLYRGVEGKLPQSHEEFMEKVIQANGIQLPPLAADSRYVWDAEKGELMVERQRSR